MRLESSASITQDVNGLSLREISCNMIAFPGKGRIRATVGQSLSVPIVNTHQNIDKRLL